MEIGYKKISLSGTYEQLLANLTNRRTGKIFACNSRQQDILNYELIVKKYRGGSLEFLHRAVIDDDGQMILFLSGTTRMKFSILSCLHRCRWCSIFFLYLLFIALLRPVRFLLQNRGNVASIVWKSHYTFKIKLAHWLAVAGNACKAGR